MEAIARACNEKSVLKSVRNSVEYDSALNFDACSKSLLITETVDKHGGRILWRIPMEDILYVNSEADEGFELAAMSFTNKVRGGCLCYSESSPKDRKLLNFHIKSKPYGEHITKFVEAMNQELLGENISVKRKTLVVINPRAGKGNACAEWEERVQPLMRKSRKFEDFQVLFTQHKLHACDFGNELASRIISSESGNYNVVILGGDGVVFELLNGIYRSFPSEYLSVLKRIVWCPLPCGSGNGLCYSSLCLANEPFTMNCALRLLMRQKFNPKDLGIINFEKNGVFQSRLFSLTISWGLVAEVDINSEFLRTVFGDARFTIYGIIKVLEKKTLKASLAWENSAQEIKPDYLTVYATLVPVAARTVILDPGKGMADGSISVHRLIGSEMNRFALVSALDELSRNRDHSKHISGFAPILSRSFELVPAESSPAGIVVDGEQLTKGPIKMETGILESVVAEALACAANASPEIQTSLTQLLSVVQKPVVDILKLRAHVLVEGLPPATVCAPSLRALVWRLLLGLISPVRADWAGQLDSKRAIYEKYVFELVHEPEQITYLRHGLSPAILVDPEYKGPVERRETTDHPLALPDSPSRWRRYWSDQEIFDQVNKDVFRTRPELSFFSTCSDSKMNTVTVRGNAATQSYLASLELPTSPKTHAFLCANIVSPKSHYDRICRILFLYAKLNFGYVQGMNELVAPLYFTFFHDPLEGHFVEADCFFALNCVMQDQRDIFCKNLDDSSLGMRGRLHAVEKLIAKTDPPVAAHLAKIGVKVQFFALRWIMLLFAQEFDIYTVQVIWDSLFADQTSSSFQKETLLVHLICVAMIEKVREAVLAGDFTDVMRVLQRYPPFQARDLIAAALDLRRTHFPDDAVPARAHFPSDVIVAPQKLSVSVAKPAKTGFSIRSKLVSLVKRKIKFKS